MTRKRFAIVLLVASLWSPSRSVARVWSDWACEDFAQPISNRHDQASYLAFDELGNPLIGAYGVIVSNDFGHAFGSEATLDVLVPPSATIYPNPEDGRAVAGETVLLFASPGHGSPPLTYQWLFNGQFLAESSNLLGLTNVQVNQAGTYQVRIENSVGVATDQVALVVSAPLNLSWIATTNGGSTNVSAAAGLAVDDGGNVFVTGSLVGSKGTNILTCRYAADGTLSWARKFATNRTWGDGLQLAANSLYVVGERSTPPSILLLKYDLDGNLLWNVSKPVVATGLGARILVDPTGASYLVYPERNATNAALYAISLARYTASGSPVWTKTISSDREPGAFANAKKILPGGILLAGLRGTNGLIMAIQDTGAVLWQDGVTNYPSADLIYAGIDATGSAAALGMSSSGKIFLTKYSSTGQNLWSRDVGGYKAAGLEVDSAGNFLVATDTAPYLNPVYLLITKFSPDGVPVWTNSYRQAYVGGTFRIDAANNIYFAGSSLDVDYQYGFLILKYDSSGRLLSLTRHHGTSLDAFSLGAFVIDSFNNAYVAGRLGTDMTVIKYGRQFVQPRLTASRATDGGTGFDIRLTGEPGFAFSIEQSQSLTNWSPWTNIVNLSGEVTVRDQTSNGPGRFFRGRQEP